MQPHRVMDRALVVLGALSLMFGSALAGAAPGMEEVAAIEIQFQQSKRKNALIPQPSLGQYWGSGNGQMTGKLDGSVHWDLYEDQSRDDLHRAQLVGVVITPEGERIPFEGLGFYKPRDGGWWDLTASFHFDCTPPGCRWPRSQPLLWKGSVKMGEWIHRARLYAVQE